MTERQPVVAWTEYGFDAKGHSHIKGIAHRDAIEAWRRNAQNFERIAVERETLSNHRWITGKISLPKRVADVCGGRGATGLVIFRTDQPPQNRLDAKDVKEITADADAFCSADLPTGGQIESLAGPSRDFRKPLLTFTDLLPNG